MGVGLAVAAIFLALLFGVAAGWLAWGQGASRLRAERRTLDERLRAAETGHAAAEERSRAADLLRRTLDAVTSERDVALRELEKERATSKARADASEAQLLQLRDAKEQLSAQFTEVGAKLLSEAQREFLLRADQRFHQAGEKSEAQMRAILQPVSETLKRHEESVTRIDKERTEAYGNLTGLIDAMRTGQEAVRGEAAKLVNALRAAPKARGRWGEQQLRNVLETCGLAEHTDFQTEVSVGGEDGRLRPDAIIRVPGGRSLVIDAKVSLNAYQDAYAAVEEVERARHLSAHSASMKAHVNGLGGKAYWAEFADAPDYVIMFVPGEHFLSAALEHDPTLWDFAFSKRVLLATPTNLIAIARTVAAVWRQEKLADQAKQIGALGKEMHDRIAVAANHLKRVGGGLNTALRSYNDFVGSFERNVVSTGRKFKAMNIETGAKEIEDVPLIETLPRYAEGEGLLEAQEAAE